MGLATRLGRHTVPVGFDAGEGAGAIDARDRRRIDVQESATVVPTGTTMLPCGPQILADTIAGLLSHRALTTRARTNGALGAPLAAHPAVLNRSQHPALVTPTQAVGTTHLCATARKASATVLPVGQRLRTHPITPRRTDLTAALALDTTITLGAGRPTAPTRLRAIQHIDTTAITALWPGIACRTAAGAVDTDLARRARAVASPAVVRIRRKVRLTTGLGRAIPITTRTNVTTTTLKTGGAKDIAVLQTSAATFPAVRAVRSHFDTAALTQNPPNRAYTVTSLTSLSFTTNAATATAVLRRALHIHTGLIAQGLVGAAIARLRKALTFPRGTTPPFPTGAATTAAVLIIGRQ